MGCTASKSLEMQARMDGWSPPVSRGFVRSLSMPLRKQMNHCPAAPSENTSAADDINLHLVALTSTTYGALNIPEVEEGEDSDQGKSCELVNPQQQQQLVSVPEAEVIDLHELMRDLNEDEQIQQQRVVLRKRKNSGGRVLSRSISSVDSMRELDVKIRSVALALPNLEKKLLALDALNSISRSHEKQLVLFHKFDQQQQPQEQQQMVLFNKFQQRSGRVDSVGLSPPRKKHLAVTKSMKGLFYGATLPQQRQQQQQQQQQQCSDHSSTTVVSSSTSSLDCSSTSSYDASSSAGDSDESTLFDPEVLKQFQRSESSSKRSSSFRIEDHGSVRKSGKGSVLESLPELCPPKGVDRVVLYVTSLRGIRKTFEDCNRVRMIIQGFGIAVDERDVSMHSEFRQELNQLVSRAPSSDKPISTSVPRLFIRGRYVGGVDEVAQLNEEGDIEKMVEGLPKSSKETCEGCGGVRFVPCFECSGSCKVVVFGGKVGDYSGSGVVVRCPDCNENGLIRCPVCF